MKRFFYIFFCLALFVENVLDVKAQPAQKLVNVVISPNHKDWRYKAGEEVVFTVQVLKNGNLMENVTVDYELGPEYFPDILKKDVLLKDGKMVLKSSMKKPGFLRCKVRAKCDGLHYDGMATAAIDEDKIEPTTKKPEDFDTFWTKAIAEARKLPLDAKLLLLPDRCTSTQNVYEVSFQNENPGSRIYGILIMPKKEGKYPAVLQVPGAGIRPYNGFNLGDDVITLEIGIHGIPVTLSPSVYLDLRLSALQNYQEFNKNDKDKFYYKRVYLGCVRAIDFLTSLPQYDGETVGVTGGSQGGALSIVTAALDSRVKFLAALYPALCDYAGYLNKRAGGWPHYFQTAEPKPGEVETLAYYDVVNFARRIKVPGWYSWGYNDYVCPPTSMYSAYNVIPATKELHVYMETAHWHFREQQTERVIWIKEKCGKTN
jgi:cephalosporin-C deacetylase